MEKAIFEEPAHSPRCPAGPGAGQPALKSAMVCSSGAGSGQLIADINKGWWQSWEYLLQLK